MPRDRHRGRWLRSPLFVTAVVGALLTVGWLQYAQGRDSISQARPGADLFPVVQTAAENGPHGSTAGWGVGHSDDADAVLDAVHGHVTERAVRVRATRYVSGDVTLTSPRIAVPSDDTYLFKAYATSDVPFTLLVRATRPDGTEDLRQLRDYPAQGGWSTVSDAFRSGPTTSAVQYVFRLAAAGTLTVDGAYLEPARDVDVQAEPPTGPNLIPNPELTGAQPDAPDQWSPYTSGESTVGFRYARDAQGGYLQTDIRDYRDGEAKWQYPPIAVSADRHYRFTATYRSQRPVDVVAEYELADGGRHFVNLSTVPPAGDWTSIAEDLQAPDGAAAVMVTLISHGNGSTAMRSPALVDVTEPGPLRWSHPIVSITFDDGRQSACEQALPLLQERGLTGTFYVNAATIETPRFMTADELSELSRAGNEVAAHAFSDVDLTTVDAGRIDEQLRKGRDELAEAGLSTGDLATPLGRTDAQVQWYARKYFQTVRGMDAGVNTRQNLDPLDLRALYVTDQTTPAVLQQYLAEADRSNGWLILVYHEISDGGSSSSDHSTVSRDALAAQLDLVRDSGIPVEPVSRAFAELQGS